ncbi:MAG: sodium:proton antiporter [Bacteroidales bacterium]|nr:sodium:proton antiporter [Bacteroidales bacterium]
MRESSPTALPKIHWTIALIPFLVLVALQVLVIRQFGSDAIDGASQTVLLFVAGVAAAISMIFYKVSWKNINNAIGDNIKTIGPAVLILFLIGAISGSWMISGVVPTMIYYGMQILTPSLFLFFACLICALVSLVTGSSWTTVATVGIALIGIGTAHGYAVGWTAGAIISGAYFGDKISPLSDTTVLASSVGEVPLFKHIRYMLITTIPSFTIALIIFLAASLSHTTTGIPQTESFADGLQSTFCISPWLLFVPVFTGVLIALRLPAAIILFLSALSAGGVMLFVQPEIVAGIGNGNMFRGMMMTFYSDTSIDTGNAVLSELVQTRGMKGMLSTVFLIFCASTFGGALTGGGMMQSLTSALARGISGRRSLVTTTVGTGLFANMATGDQYLSIVLTGNIYKKLYRDKGFEGRLLSRSTEDSATVTSVLIPWNTCGMTQSMVLKVPTLDYIPYCFFNIISPLMSITIAMIGYKIFRHDSSANMEQEESKL